jgi:hypothetical protein
MWAAIVAVMLATGQAGAPPAVSPPEPAAKSALAAAQDNVDQAQQLYLQSCSDRAYGSYDDICGQLAERVRQERVELDRLQRTAEKNAKSTASLPKP